MRAQVLVNIVLGDASRKVLEPLRSFVSHDVIFFRMQSYTLMMFCVSTVDHLLLHQSLIS